MKRDEHRRQQIDRVDAYKAWLAAGSPAGSMPAPPRDADFKVWREAQTDAATAPAAAQRHDDCPECGARRTELVVATGRFHCPTCGVATSGPAPLRVGSQLSLDQPIAA